LSVELKEAALDAAANGIIIADIKGVIEWVNPAFTKMTGYTYEEAVGRSTNLLKSGKQDPAYYEDLWGTVTSGRVWKGELINRRKDGSTYTEEMTITPVRNGGELTHYIAIKQDVTARREAEDKLEEARTLIQAILNATSEAMILISPSDHILWLNKGFERMFNVVSEEALGHSFSSMLHHWEKIFENPEEIKQRFEEAARKKELEYRETVPQIWPVKREMELYSVPVNIGEGVQLGRLYVFRDVTTERAVERMKDDFVSLVSHEFRTPLTSIKGYVELLLAGDAGKLLEDQQEFLEVVSRNTDLLTLLVNDLLEVSKIESGALKLKRQNTSINDLIQEASSKFMPQIKTKNQSLGIQLDENLPQIHVDPQRITQILMNLISNATKYTPEGGEIQIVASQEGGFINVAVIDTGVGISEENQTRLFTKFFRVEDPEIQRESGTGLGLWITHRLVEMHGGAMDVSSRLGEGTKFTFTLPIT